MPIEKAGDKRRIRYERASGVGDVRYCHVSGEWNDATTVTARINQSDKIHGKHIDPSGWAGREIGRFVADFCDRQGDERGGMQSGKDRRLMLEQGFGCTLHKHGRKLTGDRFMADSSSKNTVLARSSGHPLPPRNRVLLACQLPSKGSGAKTATNS
ncbi:hypothetical protein LI328DRAFT_158557 [Trichoderma asperelloides]|nr:hypothetical protein LI328DRAFT_158557 [Trichoderma asperelloides]